MVAGLALGPRLHRRRRSAADLRHAGAEAALPAAPGQRRGALRLRPDRAVRRLRPDRPAHDRRRRPATTSRSPAKSSSSPTPCPGRTIGLVVMLEGQAGRAHRRAAAAGERAVPDRAATACTPCGTATTTACASTTSACRARTCSTPPHRRRPDHRLSRPEPRPAVAVRRRGRHACASCWPTCCRGPSSAAPTASRSRRASWSSAASPAWPA